MIKRKNISLIIFNSPFYLHIMHIHVELFIIYKVFIMFWKDLCRYLLSMTSHIYFIYALFVYIDKCIYETFCNSDLDNNYIIRIFLSFYFLFFISSIISYIFWIQTKWGSSLSNVFLSFTLYFSVLWNIMANKFKNHP